MSGRTADPPTRSRVHGPGFRAAFVLAAVALAVLIAGLVLYLDRSSAPRSPFAPSASSAHAKYGGLPSWLPKQNVAVGRIVHAGAAHPWLAIEGDTVAVALRHGSVTASAVGPAVPEEGRFPVPKTTRCTFTVTFTAAAGAVPLRARDFTIRDELGALHRPRVTGPGGAPLPRSVPAGRPLSIRVAAVLPTGAGTLRWSAGSPRPIVSWDFDVEVD